jgi:hypothetical protein
MNSHLGAPDFVGSGTVKLTVWPVTVSVASSAATSSRAV